MEEQITLGTHSVRFEKPYTLFLDWQGTLTSEDIVGLSQYATKLRSASVPEMVLVVNANEATGVNAAARKQIVDLAGEKYWHTTLFHGASFRVRVLCELIINAINLVAKNKLGFAFVDSEADARRWVAEQAAKK